MSDTSIFESAFKTIGYVQTLMVKCGKKNCKCQKGKEFLHGPYHYYRYWKLTRNKYHQKRLYISSKQFNRLQKAINNYRDLCRKFIGITHSLANSTVRSETSWITPTLIGKNGNLINERKTVREMLAEGTPIERNQLRQNLSYRVKHML